MVDRRGPIMKPELNCSSQCDSPLCFIQSGVNRQEGLDILQRLCGLSTMAEELPRHSLSPVLTAVMWTLLSSGILLAFCFLLFTLRFKNNRIVKMSSPNLNILTLFGSVLTYGSGFLFAVDERAHSQGGASTAVIQAQMWMLCVGSTLVFGPILGKTWRLYRVFTQRVPDKRVIIRDIQLMVLVALLILVDMLILTTWNFTDPIRCSRSVGAVVKMMEQDISYSLSQMDTCSSLYSNLWIIIIAFQKGSLLLYGVYLAGLTSNVSHPPVNQSPTIITAVTLVIFSSIVAIPVSIFLQAWPNLVYSTVAGAIFICTLATNCMLFVPQLTQWRQFEHDQNNPSQMAKYFSSPSKSQPSVYSQDEICYLLGENSSMKKLLNEKNTVIDSLQEQVNNAKDKLLRLMSASHPPEVQDMDCSTTNFNSSSTQTTGLQSQRPPSPSSVSLRDPASRLSPYLPAAPASAPAAALSSETVSVFLASVSPPMLNDIQVSETQTGASTTGSSDRDTTEPMSPPFPGLARTAEETIQFVTSVQSRGRVEAFSAHAGLTFQLEPAVPPSVFISSEQLQEILQELSMDAVTESSLRSPGQASRASSQLKPSTLSPLSLQAPCSPPPPDVFRYPSISPYAMRKRRPPFHSPRRGLAPPCFYAGSDISSCGQTRNTCERQHPGKHPEGPNSAHTLHNSDLHAVMEEEDSESKLGTSGKCQGCISRSLKCSVLQCAEQHHVGSPDVDVCDDNGRQRKHLRDSCGYWDSDSSSSTDYCYYHRPYCESCLQRGSLMCSDSSSDSSDSEYDDFTGLYRPSRPVVFKEDLKPTFV